jgi:WXG100 family type VII secretion target
MEGTLLVTPEELRNTATAFSGKASEVEGLLDEMLNIASNLSSSWTGNASDAYRTKFANLQSSKETTLNMMNEHVTDLNDMADQYTTAETSAMNAANDLTQPSFD